MIIVGNALGFGIYALNGSIDAGAAAAAIGAVGLAVLGALKLVTPALAESIRTLGPALAELQKQREEIQRGSLSEQVADLHVKLNEAQAALIEQAKIRDADIARLCLMLDASAAELKATREELQATRAELQATRENLRDLRALNLRLLVEVTEKFGINVKPPESGRDPSPPSP